MQPSEAMAADKTLTRDEIDVWWMATDTVGCEHLHRWLEMLDEEERERSARFHFEIDRREFIAAHALLRSILSSYVNSPAHQWRFTRDANGKPKIHSPIGSDELLFNLSHTRPCGRSR
jgi:4'-phosphopantetheinyl transferase